MIESTIKYGECTEQKVFAESICSFENKFVFVTGGLIENSDKFSSAVRLDLVSCKWVREPDMNYRRARHSSCAFEKAVFVFCGASNENVALYLSEHIEKLSIPVDVSQQRAW